MEDLQRYLDDIAEPTITDFEANPTSVRHAFLACVAVCHAVDYLEYPRKPTARRQKFRMQSAAFALVDDVGHAFKHVITGERSNPRLISAEVISRPPLYYGVSGAYDLSRYNDPIGGVTLNKNCQVDLLDALKGAVKFLRDFKHPKSPKS